MNERQIIVWALLIVAGATCVILWQHAMSTAAVLGALSPSGTTGPSTAPAVALYPQTSPAAANTSYALGRQIIMTAAGHQGAPIGYAGGTPIPGAGYGNF